MKMNKKVGKPYNVADAWHVNFLLTAYSSFEINFLTTPFWEGVPLSV